MRKKLTLQEAYKYAVIKWQYIVNNDGESYGLRDEYPELINFRAGCSYCELFWDSVTGCKGCPLKARRRVYIREPGCRQPKHSYNIWDDEPTKANAQAVLDLIIKTRP